MILFLILISISISFLILFSIFVFDFVFDFVFNFDFDSDSDFGFDFDFNFDSSYFGGVQRRSLKEKSYEGEGTPKFMPARTSDDGAVTEQLAPPVGIPP